jgi:hypothetical protein
MSTSIKIKYIICTIIFLTMLVTFVSLFFTTQILVHYLFLSQATILTAIITTED